MILQLHLNLVCLYLTAFKPHVLTYVNDHLFFDIINRDNAHLPENPNAFCNPTLGETSTWSIVVGLLFALISLTWTGFSYTSDKRLGGAEASDDAEEGDVGGDEEEPTIAGGVVLNNSNYGTADTTSPPKTATADDAEEVNPKSFGSSWKLNAGEFRLSVI